MTIPFWIPVTIGAAFFQVWRTALQARLRQELSTGGASFIRYLFAIPVDIAMLLSAWWWFPVNLPTPSLTIIGLCLGGGVAQIIGTVLLITAFGLRNFVVGTAYAKTEAAQLVLITVVFFGAHLPALAILGIMIAVLGVLALSFVDQPIGLRALILASVQPAALCGLGAGFAFALTALAIRAASLRLPLATPVVLKAALILLITNTLQTLVQGTYMMFRQREQLHRCMRAWRKAAPVGALSAIGSLGWFTGFALTAVALVRGLGQIEMVFTFLFGHHFLKERVRWQEILAVLVVTGGVVMIIAADIP